MTQWWQHAACKGLTHLFFPRNGQVDRARRLCDNCPVQQQCKAEAMHLAARGELHGMWANTTKRQRENLVGRHRSAWWHDE